MKKVFGFTAISGLVLVAVAVFAVAPAFAMGSGSVAAPVKLPGPDEASKDAITTTHFQVFDARAAQVSNSAATTGQATQPMVVSPAASGSNSSASTSSDHQFDNSKNNGVYPLGKQGLNP